MKGIEPPTPSLPWTCSTPELHWLVSSAETFLKEILLLLRAKDEIRTRDRQFGKLELYQLSYFRLIKLTFSEKVGVVGLEPTQPKHWIYSPAHLSNCGAPP
jgi:hypothetical protein